MSPKKAASEHWKHTPEVHDYPAAESYLTLVASPELARAAVAALESAPIVSYQAKDLLRASRLELLGEDNPHVAGDLRKIRKGERLSPVLVVRGSAGAGLPLTVADGYHRICASWHTDEDESIPCKIVDLPQRGQKRSQ